MYKVFVEETPIILSTQKIIGEDYYSLAIKEANITKIVKKIKKGELTKVNLFHPREQKLLKHLRKQLPPVIAAGGLVKNAEGKTLFIFRNNRWDLPKGKVEKEELVTEAAIREVAEETGVKGLTVVKPLPITYHVLKRNRQFKLKVTHWFEMYTDFKGELAPQTKEDITEAVWKTEEECRAAFKNSYRNIKLLFPADYRSE